MRVQKREKTLRQEFERIRKKTVIRIGPGKYSIFWRKGQDLEKGRIVAQGDMKSNPRRGGTEKCLD